MKYVKITLITIILLLGFLLIYNWRILIFDSKVCGLLSIIASIVILINEIKKEQKLNRANIQNRSWKILGQSRKGR